MYEHKAVIQLVGKKSDLASSRVVTTSEAESFAKKHNFDYIEVSALDGSNVSSAFFNLAKNIIKKGIVTKSSNDFNTVQTVPQQEQIYGRC